MLKKIEGQRYRFEIFLEDEAGEQEIEFYIRAICKSTKRTSCINNLNEILSLLFDDEVEHYLDDKGYVDSSWVVPKNEAKRFMRTSQEFLSDKLYMKYLEDKLDEDRECGEWENENT